MEVGWVVGVAVGRGSGLKGAAEAAEAGSISPPRASIKVSSVAAASNPFPRRTGPNQTSDADTHRVNRFVKVFFAPSSGRDERRHPPYSSLTGQPYSNLNGAGVASTMEPSGEMSKTYVANDTDPCSVLMLGFF